MVVERARATFDEAGRMLRAATAAGRKAALNIILKEVVDGDNDEDAQRLVTPRQSHSLCHRM